MTGMEPESFINKSIHDFGYPPDFMLAFTQSFDDCVKTLKNIKIIVNSDFGLLANKYFDIQFVPIIDYVANDRKNHWRVFNLQRYH